LKEVQEMKVFRYGVVALACGSMMFGIFGGCLGGKFLGRAAQGVAMGAAGDLFNVFVLDGVTRGTRVSNALADQAASNALCAPEDDGTFADGCFAADLGPGSPR
jgi:hypothetical protein